MPGGRQRGIRGVCGVMSSEFESPKILKRLKYNYHTFKKYKEIKNCHKNFLALEYNRNYLILFAMNDWKSGENFKKREQ